MDDKKSRLYSKADQFKGGGWSAGGGVEYAAVPKVEKAEIKVETVPTAPPAMGGCKLSGCPLAMTYTPVQKWKETYDTDTALDRGTIFPELDYPFLGGGAKIDE